MQENIKKEETNKNKKPNKKPMLILIAFYTLFVAVSYIFNFDSGIKMGENFAFFAIDMIKLFPPAFILVGLFMVWVDRKTIEKYFGEKSGLMGHLAAILLACTTLYPFVVVLPMAAALSKKGARLSIVLTYLGASAICRIPMTIFEASFLGLKFSILRYVISLPLIVLSSIFIEKIVGRKYMLNNPELDS
ncbi:MAG: permease [Clostridiales bacterium]|nr:permease [Clostridiales bacterium]